MPVTIATQGTNSALITYTAGSLLSELMSQVQTYMTLRGWEVWDAAAGTSAVCYRVLQPGGTSGTTAHYHYVVLDFGTSGFMIVRHWQLWDNVAHTGTNKAPNTFYQGATVAETALAQRYDMTNGGTLLIHAATRFLGFLSALSTGAVGSSSGNAATVFLTRQRAETFDTLAAGIPSGCWASAGNIVHSNRFDYRASLTQGPLGVASTPTTASQQLEIVVPGCVFVGTFSSGAVVGARLTVNAATGKAYASDLYVGLSGNYLWGRLYDALMMTNGQAADGDDVIIEVDADGFFQRGSGTQKTFRAFYSAVAGGHVLLLPK